MRASFLIVLRMGWLVMTGVLAERPALAAELVAPAGIVLHVSPAITDQRFLPPLLAELGRTLAPPSRAVDATYDPVALRSMLGTMDGAALAQGFGASIDWAAAGRDMQVLLLPDDIRIPPARFNFAVSMRHPQVDQRVIVVSLSRLMDRGLMDRADRDPSATAERIARMIVKNTARLSGLLDSDRCVMGFPRSREELDAMPLGFCEPDLSALVRAGIARR